MWVPLASIWHDVGGSITYHVGQRRRSDLLIARGFRVRRHRSSIASQLVYSPIAFRSRDIFAEAEPLRRPGMPRDSGAIANEELWAEWFGPGVGEVQVRVNVEGVIHLEDAGHRRQGGA
jgi:hypothetical protein